MKEVCIIGAGVAGLAAARYLRECFKVTIYEASSAIGGIWRYNKGDESVFNGGTPTPMYKNLRTNLPKQLMSFRDHDYEDEIPTFPTHSQVMDYLEKYCTKFGVINDIQFSHPVLSVKPLVQDNTVKWLIKTQKEERVYDAIAVCSGRYDIPHLPTIPGLPSYTGHYIHSKDYADPSPFLDQHVLLVGAHASGMDLLLDLAKSGVKVDISHRRPDPICGLPEDAEQYPEPIKFEDDLVYFKGCEDGYKFDTIIFATGYETNLGILDPACMLETEVLPRPLYRYTLNPKYPTMAVFNQAMKIAPVLFSEYQALYFRDVLLGKIELDTCEKLTKEANDIVMKRDDRPLKNRYELDLEQFEVNKYFAKLCKVPLEGKYNMDALCKFYDRVGKDRARNPSQYKYREYKLCEKSETFILN